MASQTYRDILSAHSPIEKVPVPRKNRYRPYTAIKQESASVAIRGGRDFSGPIRSRRELTAYAFEDPNEARAVSKDVLDGSILERIVYKRNLSLYGNPGPHTWTAQKTELGGKNTIGGIAIDFFYWLVKPEVALEVQGAYWHDAFAAWGDTARAFLIGGYGYRYVELLEVEILGSTDIELDARIKQLVGQSVPFYNIEGLSRVRPFLGLTHFITPFKENRRIL